MRGTPLSAARGFRLAWALIPALLPAGTGAGQGAGSGAPPAADAAPGWSSFRGPGARGYVVDADPPVSWSVETGENVLWKVPVPTPGRSSPVVWGKRVFLTGADDSGRQVYGFDADTGALLWRHEVDGIPGFPAGSETPRVMEETGLAAPTATTDGRRVAALFGTGELVCVNVEGERMWSRHLGVPRNHYGHASSLMSHEGLLFVQYDQAEDSRLLALDMATGDTVWDAERDSISWASPILVDNAGRMELILVDSVAVQSYDPKTGTPLWRVPCLGAEVAPSAAYTDGIVFVSADGTFGSAIDVESHPPEPEILWQWYEALPDAATPLAKDGFIVVPTAYGVVTLLDARTGSVLWEADFDRGFWSSPVAAGDRVYLIDDAGTVQVLALGAAFQPLGSSGIGEDAYATPALAGDRIYIRGTRHLFCIGAT